MDNRTVSTEELENQILSPRTSKEKRLWDRIAVTPPIIQTAILAIIEFEERLDPTGYDLCYYATDLPRVVIEAIEPWNKYCEDEEG
jgi:hypothetical protein